MPTSFSINSSSAPYCTVYTSLPEEAWFVAPEALSGHTPGAWTAPQGQSRSIYCISLGAHGLNAMSSGRASSNPPHASFGVGCFHFGLISHNNEEEFNPSKYVEDVQKFLSSYPNIEDIEISAPVSYRVTQYYSELDEDGEISSGIGIYPWITNGLIKFKANIPARVQEDLWQGIPIIKRTAPTESYIIVIVYNFEFPVAIVSGADHVISKPSDAVVVIRKYLEKYAPKDSNVQFQFLGPSPFHANFFVEESTDFTFDIDKQYGYHRVSFGVPPAADSREFKQVLSGIECEIVKELGLYYKFIQARNYFDNRWNKYTNEVSLALDIIKKDRSFIRKIIEFGAHPKFDSLSIDLIDFEIDLLEELRDIRNAASRLRTHKVDSQRL